MSPSQNLILKIEFFKISDDPIQCPSPERYNCSCHFWPDMRANIFNCSSSGYKTLPVFVPNYTDWIWLENNNVDILSPFYYISNMKFLNLKHNKITFLSSDFLDSIFESETIRWIDLSENNLVNVPSKMKNLIHLQKIWLSGNLFHCDCSMTWMIGWLNNFTTSTKEHVIQDYQKLKCHSGKMKGRPIYLLNEVDLGCFPNIWTTWQKVSVGIGSGFAAIIIITLSILVIKRSRDIKFFFYYYCKLCICFGVPRDDKNEKLDHIEYDAFLYYRLDL